jgi:hypothetical protein
MANLSPPLIPGKPNIQELGYISADYFITVKQAQPDTPFNRNTYASVGITKGSAELITYVSFNVGKMSAYPGATANSKCFLVPLPATVDAAGSKNVNVFSLTQGQTLATSMTYNGRLSSNNQLSTITFGGANGTQVVSMQNFGASTPNFGGIQQFQVRCTGDNALITFDTSPGSISPNGMVLVIANVS